MFKFSFQNPNEDNDQGKAVSDPKLQWLPSEKIQILPSHVEKMLSSQDCVTYTEIGNLRLAHISTKSIISSIAKNSEEDSCITEAEKSHSDLIPAKYEGGLKIWECTEDLLEWLLSSHSKIDLSGKSVLDLGCGAGLLGIAALKFGAKVIFQDYNKEVLDMCTIPNVLLNLTDEESCELTKNGVQDHQRCEFYSGDWSFFPDKFCEGREEMLKFDYILTSETIYNPENYLKLCKIFKQCLKSSGCVFLAAKTYYFGVGGGLRQFETFLLQDGSLKTEVCWRCHSGLSREILKITFTS